MDEGVVEGGEDVADAEDVLALGHLRTQADHLLLLLLLPFTRSHLLLRKRSQTCEHEEVTASTPTENHQSQPAILYTDIETRPPQQPNTVRPSLPAAFPHAPITPQTHFLFRSDL